MNNLFNRRVLSWKVYGLLASCVFCLVSLTHSSLCAQTLQQTVRSDGHRTTYYTAGDPFLTAGFKLLDDYWSDLAKNRLALIQGHLDNYLPIALKRLHYQPADDLMRTFATAFFAARNAKTGLIPYSYDGPLYGELPQSANSNLYNLRTGGKQPVISVARGMELCEWFPDDRALQQQCLALAEATMQAFDFRSPTGAAQGMWGWVDVKTGGEPRGAITLTQDYGDVAKGLAYLSQTTGDSKFSRWAAQKLQFVWDNRLNPNLPLLQEQFTPTGALDRPEERSSDTDTLYYVRQLFELYRMTGEAQYRDWAMAVTDLWFDKAWNPQWGHFVRKLNPDGTQAVDSLYGDGKYNTLYILTHAYRVTKNPKYLDRLQLAWNNLQAMGQEGFVAERMQQGKRDPEQGLDSQQTLFLDILVDAYEASGDVAFLSAAEALGNRILQRGESVMRLEGGQAGQAFLRLALARQPIGRLEVAMPQAGSLLTVQQGNQRWLEVTVPGETAVVYLPTGSYTVITRSGGVSQEQVIHVDRQVPTSFRSSSSGCAEKAGHAVLSVAIRAGKMAGL